MSSTETNVAFTITEVALGKVRTLMTEQGLAAAEANLRVFVEGGGGGCCGGGGGGGGGMGFGMAFDEPQEGDVRLERGGLTVLIDPQSLPWVNGVTIDFVDGPEATGFKVSAPPMERGGCGDGSCGSGGGGGGGGGGGCCSSEPASDHGHAHGGHGHEHAQGGHSHGKKGGCCG